MTSFFQIIFWIVLPAVCIYFRLKKRINTSFAFFGIFTSFLLGLLMTGTFMEMPGERLIKFINQDKIEEAKGELRIILQKDPAGVRDIDRSRIINLTAYDRMQKELEKEYIQIVEKSLDRCLVTRAIDCASLDRNRESLAGLENALRLLRMAEGIGGERPGMRDELNSRIKNGSEIIESLEERCK